jgi:hypothetical protein
LPHPVRTRNNSDTPRRADVYVESEMREPAEPQAVAKEEPEKLVLRRVRRIVGILSYRDYFGSKRPVDQNTGRERTDAVPLHPPKQKCNRCRASWLRMSDRAAVSCVHRAASDCRGTSACVRSRNRHTSVCLSAFFQIVFPTISAIIASYSSVDLPCAACLPSRRTVHASGSRQHGAAAPQRVPGDFPPCIRSSAAQRR